MLLHSKTLSWFWVDQSLLLLFKAAEKQQIPNFMTISLTQQGLEHTIYHTQGKHANHYTNDTVTY
jgi:hypothetical protein